ncbi:hypothetical protein HGRIS_009506 [Hohenbuehelia grisea]|uniref:Uncharacterized protein n=1 Tax=Hohenbuehelia grisea TaxID=104357 RepID=A0ABR3J1T2_9AGAR
MDFIPRYKQPFGLAQAIALDVPTITEEIARLENSLKHLRQTQEILRESLDSSDPADEELSKAYEENKTVMYVPPRIPKRCSSPPWTIGSASQEERILMLKLALSEKGVSSTAHYDAPSVVEQDGKGSNIQSATGQTSTAADAADDDGVYL